jgi:ABC-type phosphate transport system substrate-binding protein
MRKKLIAALVLACLTDWIPRSVAQAADVAVVVNSDSRLTNISLVDLRKIFAGEKRTWPGGVPIKLIIRAQGSHERFVLLKLLGMSESEYKQYWSAQTFRGEAESEPFTAPSLGMTLEAVRVFPGAITLIDAGDLKPGIKFIKLDGHMPGEAVYTLH